MQSRRTLIYVLLGFSAVIWLLCVFQLMLAPKNVEADVQVRPTVSYSSNYKGLPPVVVPSIRRQSLSVPMVQVAAPRMEIQRSTSPVPNSTMRIATTSSARVTVVNSGGMGGMQLASTATGSSSRGINYANSTLYIPPAVQGFITSASSVGGGSSAEDTYARIQQRGASHAKKDLLPPGVCDQCHWTQDSDGHWYCTVCGDYALDGCDCEDHYGYCRCPIDDGWQVWLFMATLVMGYGLLRKQSRRKYSF
jgi:hypothetical protein